MIGFVVFLLWAAASLTVIADVIAPSPAATPGGEAPNIFDALFSAGILGLPLIAVLAIAVALSLLQADRNVMLSALLADFDHDRRGLRSEIVGDCRSQLHDTLAAYQTPETGTERLVLVGHSMGGAIALDLARELLETERAQAREIVVVTFGCPVRIFRSGHDPQTGAGSYVSARTKGSVSAPRTAQKCLEWVDTYSPNDLFSAPMFDAEFSASSAEEDPTILKYRHISLPRLNDAASFISRFNGESHRAYLEDTEALAPVLDALASTGRP